MQSTQVRRCCGPNPFYRECLLRTKLCNQLVDTALEPLHLGRIAPTLSSLPPRLRFSLPGLLLVLVLLLRRTQHLQLLLRLQQLRGCELQRLDHLRLLRGLAPPLLFLRRLIGL